MSKFLLIFLIFVIAISFLTPLTAVAQTAPETAREEELTRLRIQILQLQIEILKRQIALLLAGAQAKPPAPAPAPVPEKRDCAQLQISWGSVQGADSYRLYRNNIKVYEGTARTFIDSGLALGKKYRYVVYGLFRGEKGHPSEVQEKTAPSVCPPKTPALSFASNPCGGQITISWASDFQATTYQLFRGRWEIYSGLLNRFIDSGLTPNESYEYKIRAGNQGGWSDFSVPASFRASGVCAPPAPEIFYVVPRVAQEGILSVEMESYPANNIRVRPGGTNLSVMAFRLKARYSDISIARIDLFFNSKIWLYLDRIIIQYNGRTIAREELRRESFTRMGNIYRLRFEGIQPVVRADSSGTIMVRVDAKEEQPGDPPHHRTIFLENNSIRGIDGLGIGQQVPISGGGERGIFVRTFRIE